MRKETEVLGINYPTAQNRLKKLIMLDLIQKANLDECFKCGNKIESAEELSIEHKTPWLDKGPEFFWDLDNIAFSHLKCNRPRPCRKVGPPGKEWCTSCQDFLGVEKFTKNASRWNGLRDHCKPCEKKYRIKYSNHSL